MEKENRFSWGPNDLVKDVPLTDIQKVLAVSKSYLKNMRVDPEKIGPSLKHAADVASLYSYMDYKQMEQKVIQALNVLHKL